MGFGEVGCWPGARGGLFSNHRMLKGGVGFKGLGFRLEGLGFRLEGTFRVEGTRKPWGNLGKLRE